MDAAHQQWFGETEFQVCKSHFFLGGLQPYSKTCLGSSIISLSRLDFVGCCSQKNSSSYEAFRWHFSLFLLTADLVWDLEVWQIF